MKRPKTSSRMASGVMPTVAPACFSARGKRRSTLPARILVEGLEMPLRIIGPAGADEVQETFVRHVISVLTVRNSRPTGLIGSTERRELDKQCLRLRSTRVAPARRRLSERFDQGKFPLFPQQRRPRVFPQACMLRHAGRTGQSSWDAPLGEQRIGRGPAARPTNRSVSRQLRNGGFWGLAWRNVPGAREVGDQRCLKFRPGRPRFRRGIQAQPGDAR